MLDLIAQLIIGFFGVASCYFTAMKKPHIACIYGIIAQPAWIYTTWYHQQWGILVLALIYTTLWGLGIYNYWFKGDQNHESY